MSNVSALSYKAYVFVVEFNGKYLKEKCAFTKYRYAVFIFTVNNNKTKHLRAYYNM